MISWWQQHMLPCAYKSFFGIDCPICGAQRSFLFLLRGDFADSFKMYPPLLFVLTLMATAIIRLMFPSTIKTKKIKQYAVVVLVVISLNYTYKIVTGNLY